MFGGYGGGGYSRRDLNDLYVLDTKTFIWEPVIPKGNQPEKRSGHQAAAVEGKLYIIGGRNNTTQLQDLWILDTTCDPPTWINPQSPLLTPYWNHGACSVMAIPSWKIFMFGGNQGPITDQNRQGEFSNEVAILETGTNRWTYPQIFGEIPDARSDMSISYDPKGARLVLFGGWSGVWHNDVYTLDVGDVVGPPYAVMDIYPSIGPITGGNEVEVLGIDFVSTPDVIVRFGTRKYYLDIPGEFVNQSKIICSAPNFTQYPPGLVDVRVALNGDSFTTTFQKYEFFSVTDCDKCVIFGPGLLSGCAVNEEVMFIIQARDCDSNNRTTGGDEFTVNVVLKEGTEEGEDLVVGNVFIKDNENGTYIVTYTAQYAGTYIISVDFQGTYEGVAGPLRGSDVAIVFEEMVSRENNSMSGPIVRDSLKNDIEFLKRFNQETSELIYAKVRDDTWSPQETIEALASVKERINLMEIETENIQLIGDRCEAILQFMKSQGSGHVSTLSTLLEEAREEWIQLKKEAPQILTRIAPMLRTYIAKMKGDIQGYEETLSQYADGFEQSLFLRYETGIEKSRELILQSRTLHEEEYVEYNKFMHLAQIFDCTKDMQGCTEMMEKISDMLDNITSLWDTSDESRKLMGSVKQMPWSSIDADGLEENAKGMLQTVRRLPKSIKKSDAYQGLEKSVKDFLATCPLIGYLRSPALRERHWKDVMKIVGIKFPLPESNPDMTLKDILDLNLHEYPADIEELSDKATKEARHEEILEGLESTWKSIQFRKTQYKETDIPLLRLTEEDMETLENDQMAVQSIVGSRFGHFKQQAQGWQQSLSTMSDSIQLILEIQKMWSYLEPLFTSSEEVQRELPDDTRRFRDVDSQVKNILKKAWKTRKIIDACSEKGLGGRLERLNSEQESCKKSLTEFIDGKRTQFPRFYFMSEADLLDLLSNSSDPIKVLKHIDKVFLATSKIHVDAHSGGSEHARAMKWHSGVGIEEAKFEPPVPLVGKAEEYLQALLDAQKESLGKRLIRSTQRYPSQDRHKWAVHCVDDVPLDPAQIMILVAGVEFVRNVEESMSAMKSGDLMAMKVQHETQQQQLSKLIELTQTDLSGPLRQRIMTMITLDAHNRDIMQNLLNEKVINPGDSNGSLSLDQS